MLTSLFDSGKDFQTLAVEKIQQETDTFHGGGKQEHAVYKYVSEVLIDFCRQNADFAEVVYKTKRGLSDIVRETMKGCGQHISDLDVYRKAAQVYFPSAIVEGHITITLGEAPDEKYMSKEGRKEQTDVPKEKEEKPRKEEKKPETIQLSLF